MTPTHFRALQRPSLCLVRPENLMLRLDLSQGRPRHRARFRLGGIQHNLALTDPLATNLHALQMHSQGAPALDMRPSFGDDCLICVSLTGEFQGFHWKLAAAIIPLVLQL